MNMNLEFNPKWHIDFNKCRRSSRNTKPLYYVETFEFNQKIFLFQQVNHHHIFFQRRQEGLKGSMGGKMGGAQILCEWEKLTQFILLLISIM